MEHKRYLLWLSLLCSLTLLPAVMLNVLLILNEGDVKAMSFAASEWQERTHGVTYTPTMGNNALFKRLRLNDRLPEVDTVIMGSSTGMPIDQSMLPAGWHLYNLTMSGSPLSSSIAQAEYLVEHAPSIKHYIIALDWALDSVYQPSDIPAFDLSRPNRAALPDTPRPKVMDTLLEATSYLRMQKLWKVLTYIAHSTAPEKTVREYFFQMGSDEYTCPDGITLGKDFGIHNRGSCNGFRYDGSATYSDYTRAENPGQLIFSALSSGSKYARALAHTQGAIDPGLFARLDALSQRIARNGGVLILHMPPLLPGLEKAFTARTPYSEYLARTKNEVRAWAAGKPVVLADFGQSEKYGCTYGEFLDEHHATSSCYHKVFANFWGSARLPDGRSLATPDRH